MEPFTEMENTRGGVGFCAGVGSEGFSLKCFLIIQVEMSGR